jgi:NAD(P)-dependent dehydrogenase (short-subunit alcohol dehydrogenase family)
MVERGIKGSIINISSQHAIIGIPSRQTDYAAAKGGVNALTRAIAAELSQYGIRVNCLMCGITRTPGIEGNLPPGAWDTIEKTVAPFHMVRRTGVPEDYVGIVVWLASNESSFCSGSCFLVDGGLVNYASALTGPESH